MKYFTQEDINIVVSHINGLVRKNLNDISASALFEMLYGKEILEKLGLKMISKNEVYLLPDLINK